MNGVWIFNGEGARFPSAAFSSVDLARAWISDIKISGTLTWYPLDVPVYDWAIAQGVFSPKNASHSMAKFIQNFSSASQNHYHFEDGLEAGRRGV